MSTTRVQDVVENMGAADGGFDAVAVVLLQHAEVFVAELVGDVFDGHSGVSHRPSMPAVAMRRSNSLRTAFGSAGRPVGEVNTKLSGLDHAGPSVAACSSCRCW